MYVCRLRHIEMQLVRWMCGASLCDRPGGVRFANEEQGGRTGLQCTSNVLRGGRVRWTKWFGHVERRMQDN